MVIDGRARQKSYYLGQNISTGTYFGTPANIFIEGEEIGLFMVGKPMEFTKKETIF